MKMILKSFTKEFKSISGARQVLHIQLLIEIFIELEQNKYFF